MSQLLGSKGLLGYIDGRIQKPPPSTTPEKSSGDTTTPIYSTNPTLDEWMFRDQIARGHITLNCTDVASLGVITSGTARDAWESIQNEWGKSTDMRRSHAQEALNRTVFDENTDIQDHIKLLRTWRAALDNLNTSAMTDETWRGIIIRSIPPTAKWLPVVPPLYAMSTSADIISTLLAHRMILGRNSNHTTAGSSNTALAARVSNPCANPQCKVKKRSSHTTDDCYWPGGGKEGQFPPNFRQRPKANAAATTTNTSDNIPDKVEHFALSVQIPITPGQSGIVIEDNRSPPGTLIDDGITSEPEILFDDDPSPHPHMALISKGFQSFDNGKIPTFMDSGASDVMFVSRNAFSSYTALPSPRMGDSAKAKDGGFEIVGEGAVSQRYKVDGKERAITYTRALHTPTLNANPVSVSALDKAGLTTTFGQGKGVARKTDGTVVLAGKGVNGMYLVEDIVTVLNVPLAMASLSQPVSLEQWHRRLTHCSPSTIEEMVTKDLVDGLVISEREIHGKCEDCILGRQTRRPFDGESEKDLLPLDLVSFDLWGPSHVQSLGGKLYLMIIVDAGTSYKHGAYLHDKTDSTTLEAFEVFRTTSEALTDRKVQHLHTDGAFDTSAWRTYDQKLGITHELSAPYSSAQNGLAERAIRTTMDDVRTLLRDSGLGHSYWAEAAAFSIATRNLIPSRRHPGHIPLEGFTGKRQSVTHLRVFGAKCWAKIPTLHGAQVTGGSKLDPRSVACRLLGYTAGGGNYKVQDVDTRRVFVSRDVVFEEGRAHRTLANVGEETSNQIPLFDTLSNIDSTLTNVSDDGINQNPALNNHDPAINNLDDHTKRSDTSGNPRRSNRVPQPSNAVTQSLEYMEREMVSKEEGHDWATNSKLPKAMAVTDNDWMTTQADHDDIIACLVETKSSHNIPKSYKHAMATDLEMDDSHVTQDGHPESKTYLGLSETTARSQYNGLNVGF